MPGKPAARLTDPTAHGGLISGPGVPTVLIGKMPAATLGDMHVCPMMTPGTPPIPHVGGPITLGSTGVMIGKKPAARMGDLAICVGPPSSVIMGCPTVMIGEVGSGSQAGSAGSAAAAAAASVKGPKEVNTVPPPKHESKTSESHEVKVAFQDASGRPLAGVWFQLKDPDGQKSTCCSTMEGTFQKGGFSKKGSFEVEICALKDPKFAKTSIKPGEKVKMQVKAEGLEDGVRVDFRVEAVGLDEKEHTHGVYVANLKGGAAEVEWSYRDAELSTYGDEGAEGIAGFRFVVAAGFVVAVSPVAKREPVEDKPIVTRAPLVSM
ncbi:MAG: PAAR domain-containing protein [Fibrobacterota bacterium]|nr:PAAR domain-containing protein [Fibrobacterota bacterium]QQS06387.1 MAG: PAAR domain-containing protein [Fibrobacterota bacterium]